MTVRQIIEDFWFDCETQEMTIEEIREELIDVGLDPDAMCRRVRLLIAETAANREMNRKLGLES